MMFIHLADAFIKHNLQVRQNAKQATVGHEKPWRTSTASFNLNHPDIQEVPRIVQSKGRSALERDKGLI